jgi:DNA-binding FadR family transcriptional regulator
LEIDIIKLAAVRATEEDILALEKAFWKLQEPGTPLDRFQMNDIEFHIVLANAAKNKILVELSKAIRYALAKNQKEACELPTIQQRAVESHKHLIDAIRQRNPDKAAKFMLEHLKIARIFHGFLPEEESGSIQAGK